VDRPAHVAAGAAPGRDRLRRARAAARPVVPRRPFRRVQPLHVQRPRGPAGEQAKAQAVPVGRARPDVALHAGHGEAHLRARSLDGRAHAGCRGPGRRPHDGDSGHPRLLRDQARPGQRLPQRGLRRVVGAAARGTASAARVQAEGRLRRPARHEPGALDPRRSRCAAARGGLRHRGRRAGARRAGGTRPGPRGEERRVDRLPLAPRVARPVRPGRRLRRPSPTPPGLRVGPAHQGLGVHGGGQAGDLRR